MVQESIYQRAVSVWNKSIALTHKACLFKLLWEEKKKEEKKKSQSRYKSDCLVPFVFVISSTAKPISVQLPYQLLETDLPVNDQ